MITARDRRNEKENEIYNTIIEIHYCYMHAFVTLKIYLHYTNFMPFPVRKDMAY